jgi:hypothetical protein
VAPLTTTWVDTASDAAGSTGSATSTAGATFASGVLTVALISVAARASSPAERRAVLCHHQATESPISTRITNQVTTLSRLSLACWRERREKLCMSMLSGGVSPSFVGGEDGLLGDAHELGIGSQIATNEGMGRVLVIGIRFDGGDQGQTKVNAGRNLFPGPAELFTGVAQQLAWATAWESSWKSCGCSVVIG